MRGDELSALARERRRDRLLRARGREPRGGALALGAQRRELPELFFERAERPAARRDPLLELRNPRAQRRLRVDIALERVEPRTLLRHFCTGRGDRLLRLDAPRRARPVGVKCRSYAARARSNRLSSRSPPAPTPAARSSAAARLAAPASAGASSGAPCTIRSARQSAVSRCASISSRTRSCASRPVACSTRGARTERSVSLLR